MKGFTPALPALATDEEEPPDDPQGDAGPLERRQAGEGFRLPDHGLVFEDLERELVRQALERAGGNQTRAAKLLGLTRDQMRYRIRKFALVPRPDAAANG